MYALFESAKYIGPNPFDMSLVNSRWQMFKMEKKIYQVKGQFCCSIETFKQKLYHGLNLTIKLRSHLYIRSVYLL